MATHHPSPAAPADEFTYGSVVDKIHQLYTQPQHATATSAWLERFQQSPQAWPVAQQILQQPMNTPMQQQAAFFAAQTIAVLAQAGFQFAKESFPALRTSLLQLTLALHASPPIIVRQLCLAICALVIFCADQMDQLVQGVITAVAASAEGHDVLLEILIALPEELFNRKIAIDPDRRAAARHKILQETNVALNAAATIFQAPVDPQVAPHRQAKSLRVLSSWLDAHVKSHEIDPPPNSQPVRTSPLAREMADAPLFRFALEGIRASHETLLRPSGDVCVAVLSLMREVTPHPDTDRAIVLAIAEALAQGGEKMKMGSNIDACLVACEVLSALAREHFPYLYYYHEPSRPLLDRLADLATHFMSAVGSRGIGESPWEVATSALGVWSHLLDHQTPQLHEMAIGIAAGGAQVIPLVSTDRSAVRQELRELLKPLFTKMVSVLMEVLRYPKACETQQDFQFTLFHQFRDECATLLTESCRLVGYTHALNTVGQQLERFKQEGAGQGVVLPPWEALEGCLFVLTAVAPRAPAGEDNVIPQTLEALPSLPYPSSGVAAVLLRQTASRLVYFTSGYIGLMPQLFAPIYALLTEQLMPFLGQAQVSDASLRESGMHVCVCAIQALCSSGQEIMTVRGSEDILRALKPLAVLIMSTYVDCEEKGTLVSSAGTLISHLSRPKLEETHYHLVKPLADLVRESLAGRRSSLVDDVRHFCTALKSVRSDLAGVCCGAGAAPHPPMPKGEEANGVSEAQRNAHPTLIVLEKEWPLVERLFAEHGSSEAIMEPVCQAITQIISDTREQAMDSSLFHPVLRVMGSSFRNTPTCFHLGALRSIVGMFGRSFDPPVVHGLRDLLQLLAEVALSQRQPTTGAQPAPEVTQYLRHPDLVGLSIDCFNQGLVLSHPALAKEVLNAQWFPALLRFVFEMLPDCAHPKLGAVMLLFLARLDAWLADEKYVTRLPHFRVSAETFRAEEAGARQAASRLILQEGGLVVVIQVLLKVIATTAIDIPQGVGITSSALIPLLDRPEGKEVFLDALKQLPDALLPPEQKQHFYDAALDDRLRHTRDFNDLLLRTAQHCHAQAKKTQFSAA
ncbi:unnamed protein product [Vitrella brassicaformis CCMP3155]|uniref:Exportin-1/Importin-beta-like domain-containing protein n=3 Tax=Vitrella brassicaformis TaxID=1169539 RepID=A0A0G4GJ31_VITBC|nr:unnamed protein product [Vitrella brassicaformis CCMP3155]|eukprot:CEM29847.1 unnamed protein product [Vitrella brassicaformis CCMP3155]